jgi:acyl-CoA thioesterase-1
MFIAYALKTAKPGGRELLHRLQRSLLAIVCALALLFTASPSKAAEKILVLGDSISAAYGIAIEDGWVALMDQSLAKTHPNRFTVVNASISGETTDGGLARLPALLKQHRPGYVILELGGNDGLRGFPIKRLRGNLTSMIEQSQGIGAAVVLVGMQIPPNYGPRYTRQFQQTYPTLAEQFNTALVTELLNDIAIHPELMQADGIHPVAAAQGKLRDKILPALLQLISEPERTVADGG